MHELHEILQASPMVSRQQQPMWQVSQSKQLETWQKTGENLQQTLRQAMQRLIKVLQMVQKMHRKMQKSMIVDTITSLIL